MTEECYHVRGGCNVPITEYRKHWGEACRVRRGLMEACVPPSAVPGVCLQTDTWGGGGQFPS